MQAARRRRRRRSERAEIYHWLFVLGGEQSRKNRFTPLSHSLSLRANFRAKAKKGGGEEKKLTAAAQECCSSHEAA